MPNPIRRMTDLSRRLCLAICFVVATSAAAAESYNLPPGPLGQTLTSVAAKDGVPLAYDPALTQGLDSPALAGEYSPVEALNALLANSGLVLAQRSDGAYTVERAPTESAGGALRLDPLTVTGERVERSVYETASAVSVRTGAQIDADPSLRETNDIYDGIPNVSYTGTSGDGPTIRGIDTTGPLIGANAFLGGGRPRSTVTVDGRPLSYFEFTNGAASVFDVERVEVFSGPQTTSQGVNSIAGAIHVVTADPTFTPEAKGQVEVGNFDSRRFSAAVSGPVIEDQLAVRLSADHQHRESFAKGIPGIQGFDEDAYEYLTLRGKILLEPHALEALSTKLTLNYNTTSEPQVEFIGPPNDDLRFGPATSSGFTSEVFSATHDVSIELSDALTLSNRFTYANSTIERFANNPGAGSAEIKQDEFHEEATLRVRAMDGRLTGLLGGSLLYADVEDDSDFTAFIGLSAFEDERTSLGVFGEATFAVTDRLDVTAGLRYQRDSQEREGFFGPFVLDFNETFDAFLPKVAVGYDVTDDVRVGAQISRGFNPGGVSISFTTGQADEFDEETVWNYELFARSSLFDDRLQLNANLFYADYYDFQRSEIVLSGGVPALEIANADRARSYGLEVSAQARATEALNLFGSVGLLDTEVTKFTAAVDPDVEGREFPRAPHLTLALGADYEVIDDLTLGARGRYTSSYFSNAANSEEFKVGSYAIFDFFAAYAFENVEAYAYLDNAFNVRHTMLELNLGGGSVATVTTPREFGAGLRVKF